MAAKRPSADVYFLALAALVATRSTCLRRAVGCVLVDARGHVLATGYNGVAPKHPHCNEVVYARPELGWTEQLPSHDLVDGGGRVILERERGRSFAHACPGQDQPSHMPGTCQALHAEWYALLQCRDVHAIATCYVTTEPCEVCTELLLSTSCRRIVALEPYKTSGRALWKGGDRVWQVVGRVDRESGMDTLGYARDAVAAARDAVAAARGVQVADSVENQS